MNYNEFRLKNIVSKYIQRFYPEIHKSETNISVE